MRKLMLCLGLSILLIACEKDRNNENEYSVLLGKYSGTFVRTGMDTAQVDFYFKNDGSYEGSSNMQHYPAICSGSYQEEGSTLIINDTCSWTANFDWTLIFDGNFSISHDENNSVRIWRTTGAITDEYKLTRYTR